MAIMTIEEKYKVLSLEAWTLYEPQESSFILVTDKETEFIHGDNFLVLKQVREIEKAVDIMADLLKR